MTICPGCGRPVDDHTVRELRACHPAEALNLPFESTGEPVEVDVDNLGRLATAVVIRAAVAPVRSRPLPALAFTFFGADGLTVVAKALLILDDTRMRELRTLVGAAIDGALTAARRAR